MPAHETQNLIHKAVLWPVARVDKNGDPVLDNVEEIDCRWNDDTREVTDAQGSTIQVDATATVDRRITIGSWMWLGKISDLPEGRDFSQEENKLMQVKAYSQTPDFKGRNFYREVGLSRATDTLPSGA